MMDKDLFIFICVFFLATSIFVSSMGDLYIRNHQKANYDCKVNWLIIRCEKLVAYNYTYNISIESKNI